MIEIFLTAYDPSDLPGMSIDPLGFERGYLFLADKLLPGLTNVAARPRYFSVLCAGISLSRSTVEQSPQAILTARKEMLLRFERFWALANVLARPAGSGGVRGVTYAKEFAADLHRRGATRTTGDYRLLSRQSQYGAIGMYASVADGMRFLNRDDFGLTPALGEVAAEALLDETAMPASLRRAIMEDADVPLSTLETWGERAHVDAVVNQREANCLHEALHSHEVRSRAVELLRKHPFQNEKDSELDRLRRIELALNRTGGDADLREAISCIIAYEACYRLALLAFERVLWVCRNHAAASVTLAELANDQVLGKVRKQLSTLVSCWFATLDRSATPGFRENLDRLDDVRRFLEAAAGSVADHSAFVEAFISRHTDVQRGKFDRGRRKMPWLERSDSRIMLTMTRAGGMNQEITRAEQLVPHPYRLGAADSLLFASREALVS